MDQRRLRSKAVQHGPSSGTSATKLAQHAPVHSSSAKNFAHRTHKHGDVETDDTSARPQQGTTETDDTSARPNKGPMKPASPLRQKTAADTPISHPQRRGRFQSHTGTSEQRRQGFQTTGPAHQVPLARRAPEGPQGLAAVRVDGDDTAARHISHVIYRGHCSRRSRNGLFRVDCG